MAKFPQEKMNKLKKQDELLATNLAIGIIGVFLIYIGIFSLFGIGENYLALSWIIIGVILIIRKFILQKKLKVNIFW